MLERRRPLLLALLALALLAGSVVVAHRISVAADRPYDVQFVPSARSLRWLSLGHPTLAANLLWLKAVQYMGDPRADARGWGKLRPLVEVVTDLDPKHGYAYQTTGNLLSASGRLADSNAILEKGTRNVPDRYILPFHRAVNAFLYAGDYADAGRWFEVAAQTPGAPPRMREYVLAMYVKGDVADAAVSFLQHLQDEAQDDESRRAIQRQIDVARLERDAGRIDEALETWRAEYVLSPVVLEQLVLAGFLPRIPADPFGGAFVLGADGRAHSTAHERRLERPPTRAERILALREGRARIQQALESNR